MVWFLLAGTTVSVCPYTETWTHRQTYTKTDLHTDRLTHRQVCPVPEPWLCLRPITSRTRERERERERERGREREKERKRERERERERERDRERDDKMARPCE